MHLRAALRERRPLVGCWHLVEDPTVTEALRNVDLDFLVFDQQHIATTTVSLQQRFLAFRGARPAALVRVLRNDTAEIGHLLDLGADGVIVPMVDTADQARQAVAAARFRPEGVRSLGPGRAPMKYEGGYAEFLQHANDSVVIVQIETVEAIANLPEILAVPGLDAVMVGPGDLAVSLGHLHDPDHPDVEQAIQTVLDACLAADVPFGLFTADPATSLKWIGRGGVIMNCRADIGLLLSGVHALAAELRAGLPTP
ncbi:2,4-dihydroxyhept-2-ene-1,7-dioic acid aldolase [Catellatospora methionotrophica]|uniref:2,4-dihydroxyhept-2-ene-1,7-dioic acid aldolase n=1 Tax=Catellatospora methionotrophica TaxID=121620 RepID=A0A8J3PCG5_9ACTN|nr:aldolase/citrate lyase family protein [Catellatospora methionotrophica]GIG11987.1 2,4-dihydroxyhept-2-ene-1,7-dioic acid aldolase [Catellatospora methionotrophica]